MKILLAVDGSKCSESAVQAVIQQYKPDATGVLVFHAVESLKLMPVSVGYGVGPMFVRDYTSIMKQWRADGEALVESVARRLQAAGFNTETKVEEGEARELILDYAKDCKPDLIVLGSHGKTGLDRFLLGSVSESVARHAHCSIQIVRDGAAGAITNATATN